MAWTFYNSSGEALIIDGGVSATAASITNDLTVTSGNVVIATAGKGIDFSANTHSTETGVSMASELLDWYEEGTWTVTMMDTSENASESQAYSQQTGFYTRIGNTVFINFSLEMSSFGSLTTSQDILIGGLPFTSANVTGNRHAFAVGSGYSLNITASETVSFYMNPNKALISATLWDAAGGTTPMTLAEFSSNGLIYASGSYKV